MIGGGPDAVLALRRLPAAPGRVRGARDEDPPLRARRAAPDRDPGRAPARWLLGRNLGAGAPARSLRLAPSPPSSPRGRRRAGLRPRRLRRGDRGRGRDRLCRPPPGFPRPSVPGHAGRMVSAAVPACRSRCCRAASTSTRAAGRRHPLARAITDLGIETLVLTNASGSCAPPSVRARWCWSRTTSTSGPEPAGRPDGRGAALRRHGRGLRSRPARDSGRGRAPDRPPLPTGVYLALLGPTSRPRPRSAPSVRSAPTSSACRPCPRRSPPARWA